MCIYKTSCHRWNPVACILKSRQDTLKQTDQFPNVYLCRGKKVKTAAHWGKDLDDSMEGTERRDFHL